MIETVELLVVAGVVVVVGWSDGGEVTVLLVSPIITVRPAVTHPTTVKTETARDTLDLPVGALIILTQSLVRPVTAVSLPVTPSPAVHTGPVTAGQIVFWARDELTTAVLVTPVTAVQPAVTHPAFLDAESLVHTLKLPNRAGKVVGSVAWLDRVKTADLVRHVLTVGYSVAPQTEADAGTVVTSELTPGTVDRTVQLVI